MTLESLLIPLILLFGVVGIFNIGGSIAGMTEVVRRAKRKGKRLTETKILARMLGAEAGAPFTRACICGYIVYQVVERL